MRRVLKDALENEPDIEVVGFAADGEAVLGQVEALRPDVITMDIEMPKKNGLIALTEVMAKYPTPVVMCSTLTSAGAEATMIALEVGAFDFVCKPTTISAETLAVTFIEIVGKVRLAGIHGLRQLSKPDAAKRISGFSPKGDAGILVIGSSTGGPQSLFSLFSSFPKDLKVPILIAQHMPKGFTKSLADRLERIGVMSVSEGVDGELIKPGRAYLAPGGAHMLVAPGKKLEILDPSAKKGICPSVDVLFESVAKEYKQNVVGAILTGMGKDGMLGSGEIKKSGGVVFGESEATCSVYGMPKAARDAGFISSEYPIQELGSALLKQLGKLQSKGGQRAA
jgi:two-component system, chemotaxis family, protein-glutamate methylesterase/glutaminase